ncbi:MAG: tRNA lysidine(34) synthetase TilS [bacterium]
MINKKFISTIKEYDMIKPLDKVLVTVSGGADSIAMLHLLVAFSDELKITLHVAHLNHMLRGKEAELDTRFVQGLAQGLKLPITVESFDVQAYANEEKLGLEDAARRVRYAFFDRIANQVGATKIAVAHTADDNVETFLMRLLRGTGIRGLCGIPSVRGKIIRPLIRCWKREVEDYVGGQKLVPRRDHTNYESKYLRNRVRLKLIPQLKVYNLNVREIILQTILLLTEDRNYLEGVAEKNLASAYLSFKDGLLRLDLTKIRGLEPSICGHLLRRAIEKVKGNLENLSFQHIQDIMKKLADSEGWELHLPDGILVVGKRKELEISRQGTTPIKNQYYFYSFSVPGEVFIKELGKTLRASFARQRDESEGPMIAFVDAASLGKNIIVRSKEAGDRFVPLGLVGSKKLQDFFVDQKIAKDERDQIPIVESGGKIIWVAGYRLDDRAKLADSSTKIVKLELL